MKLSTALNKLKKLKVEVTKESLDHTDFYYFEINGENYEFTNQPEVDDQVDGFCKNGDFGPISYNSMSTLIKRAYD